MICNGHIVDIENRGHGESLQCVDDRVDIVAHHADIRPVWSARFAHRVGKQFAADDDFMPFRLATFNERLNVSIRNAGFDEHRLDLAIGNEVDKVVDLTNARLALGANALDATHFDVVGADRSSGKHRGLLLTTRRSCGLRQVAILRNREACRALAP